VQHKTVPTGRVTYIGPIVVKRDSGLPLESTIGRKAFVPGVRSGTRRLMIRGTQATARDLPAGIDRLRRFVWSRPAPWRLGWRPLLLEHLWNVYPSPRLLERAAELVAPETSRQIHGDATAANLIRIPGIGVRWIDALDRPYVPGDWRVDVGKALQSCWGYEAALTGGRVELDQDVRLELIGDETYSNVFAIETWFLIHVARLLRYHSDHVSRQFRSVMEDEYECRRV